MVGLKGSTMTKFLDLSALLNQASGSTGRRIIVISDDPTLAGKLEKLQIDATTPSIFGKSDEMLEWFRANFPTFYHRQSGSKQFESGIDHFYELPSPSHESKLIRIYFERHSRHENIPFVQLAAARRTGITAEASLSSLFQMMADIAAGDQKIYYNEPEQNVGRPVLQTGKIYLSVNDGPLHEHDNSLLHNFNRIYISNQNRELKVNHYRFNERHLHLVDPSYPGLEQYVRTL